MSKLPPLSMLEYLAIKRHNDNLIEGAKDSLTQYRAVPKRDRPQAIQGMIDYWAHAIKALEWSNKIAEQRLGKVGNGIDAQV